MTVLSTKILTASQKAQLTNANIKVVEYNAIRIEYLSPDIDPNFKNIIFTSQNTVKAFLKTLHPQQLKNNSYNAFCVGEKTKSVLEKNGIKVMEMTNYGAELAKILADKHSHKTFLFLCSNKRRNEIPDYLTKYKVAFKEQTVYQNTPNHLTFGPDFGGILFFSPSGINSFMAKNKFRNFVAFCIGTTTAAEAKKYHKRIIVSEKPTVEKVLEKVVEYSMGKIN